MKNFDQIAEGIRQTFEVRNQARDQALMRARALTRHAAHTIRAIHRMEVQAAERELQEAGELVAALKADLSPYPDLYFAGYTQDAIKEFVEASVTCALILDQPLPSPEKLGVEEATYMNGLAESIGELRRRCLDILRQGYSAEAERLLACMDEIYAVLVTLDYPDAITNGLRRQTDVVRGIIERTRADLTISLREQQLHQAMEQLAARLPGPAEGHAHD